MSRTLIAYPWLTEGAIQFLEGIVTPQSRVLEFGCGCSTLWFAQRAAYVLSVEHNDKWAEAVNERLKIHGPVVRDRVSLCVAARPYASLVDSQGNASFDVVLVDGRDRVICAEHSWGLVKPGGVLMLDNAERAGYSPIAELMKVQGWPMSGDEQMGPRALDGFWYPGWRTVWWTRPIEA